MEKNNRKYEIAFWAFMLVVSAAAVFLNSKMFHIQAAGLIKTFVIAILMLWMPAIFVIDQELFQKRVFFLLEAGFLASVLLLTLGNLTPIYFLWVLGSVWIAALVHPIVGLMFQLSFTCMASGLYHYSIDTFLFYFVIGGLACLLITSAVNGKTLLYVETITVSCQIIFLFVKDNFTLAEESWIDIAGNLCSLALSIFLIYLIRKKVKPVDSVLLREARQGAGGGQNAGNDRLAEDKEIRELLAEAKGIGGYGDKEPLADRRGTKNYAKEAVRNFTAAAVEEGVVGIPETESRLAEKRRFGRSEIPFENIGENDSDFDLSDTKDLLADGIHKGLWDLEEKESEDVGKKEQESFYDALEPGEAESFSDALEEPAEPKGFYDVLETGKTESFSDALEEPEGQKSFYDALETGKTESFSNALKEPEEQKNFYDALETEEPESFSNALEEPGIAENTEGTEEPSGENGWHAEEKEEPEESRTEELFSGDADSLVSEVFGEDLQGEGGEASAADQEYETVYEKYLAPTQPLLKRLREELPQTYKHSLLVSLLAEKAAALLHANSQLCKVGAMYHEIGKLSEMKEYKEAGVRMLLWEEYPEDIVKIVEEHSGKESIPTSKESAIVMLTDNVVTTIRYFDRKDSLKKPSRRKIIDNIFVVRMEQGYLDDAGFNLGEYKMLKDFFESNIPK